MLPEPLLQLVAGEQIDLAFGTRLGISTLASAALGNLVADVVGVSVTHQIQSAVQHIKWAQPPRLSVLQQSLFRVKGGAVSQQQYDAGGGACQQVWTPLCSDSGTSVVSSAVASGAASRLPCRCQIMLALPFLLWPRSFM